MGNSRIPLRVLMVTQHQDVEGLKSGLPKSTSRVVVATSAFTAGLAAAELRPTCLVVDFAIGRAEAKEICQRARKHLGRKAAVVGILPMGENLRMIEGADDVFVRPLSVKILARAICSAGQSRA